MQVTVRPRLCKPASVRTSCEQQCCAFLTFGFERTGGGLVLSIAGPAEAGPALDGFQALAQQNAPPPAITQGWTG